MDRRRLKVVKGRETRRSRRARTISMLELRDRQAKGGQTGQARPTTGQPHTYIKIIRLSHFQSTIPSGGPWSVSVTNNTLEIVTSTPLSPVSSGVSLHRVLLREVVPGSKERNCLYRRMRLTVGWRSRVSFDPAEEEVLCLGLYLQTSESRASPRFLLSTKSVEPPQCPAGQ